ncbi:MAG: hypothetical protein EAZ06_06900 [Cytophagales bacterium]|nr:MAG: hypothetical protein EAZ06_06900 [Cytophagales bacterium]
MGKCKSFFKINTFNAFRRGGATNIFFLSVKILYMFEILRKICIYTTNCLCLCSTSSRRWYKIRLLQPSLVGHKRGRKTFLESILQVENSINQLDWLK